MMKISERGKIVVAACFMAIVTGYVTYVGIKNGSMPLTVIFGLGTLVMIAIPWLERSRPLRRNAHLSKKSRLVREQSGDCH